jgi:hypothetical protein
MVCTGIDEHPSDESTMQGRSPLVLQSCLPNRRVLSEEWCTREVSCAPSCRHAFCHFRRLCRGRCENGEGAGGESLRTRTHRILGRKSSHYDGYPFYDITLALGQKKYVVRYESLTGYYPSKWKAGRARSRFGWGAKERCSCSTVKRKFWPWVYKGHLQDCVPSSGRPTTMGGGPQVPCD